MSTLWPLFAFFVLMTLWFAYDGWLNPDLARYSTFNRTGTVFFLILSLSTAWFTFWDKAFRALVVETRTAVTHESPGPPPTLPRWNWGAFLLTPFWALGHRVYWGLLSAVGVVDLFVSGWLASALPFVSLLVSFALGLRGNELAWRKFQWASVTQFRRVQRIWAWCGACLFLPLLLLVVLALVREFRAAAA